MEPTDQLDASNQSKTSREPRKAVCQTEIRLSDIFDFPRKSFTLFHFADRATWLLLALEALSWRVTGTIVGTAQRSARRANDIESR